MRGLRRRRRLRDLHVPRGVFTDAGGNLLVADTDNQRIRQITNGAIATIAGTGEQGFGGDGSLALSATFNSPRSVATDATANLLIADTLNQRLRSAALPILAFTSPFVGVSGASQSVTLANTGSAPITISTLTFSGPFSASTGGTCTAFPLTLAAGSSCFQNLAYLPTVMGPVSGSLVVNGTGLLPATILLTGSAAPAATTVTLASNLTAPFVGQAITLTATVTPPALGTPTGTVTFFDGTAALGTPQPISATGSASITTTTLAVGTHSITASYSGDANFAASTSAALAQSVQDFNFTINPSSPPTQTVLPGQPATFNFVVQPIAANFSYPVVLSATGLPPGASVTFTPGTITLGTSPTSFQMTIQTASTMASLRKTSAFTGTAALALLLLPLAGSLRRGSRRIRPFGLGCLLLLGFAGTAALTGCGTHSGFFGQSQKSYTVNVVATATGTGGVTLQHLASVTLTIQ